MLVDGQMEVLIETMTKRMKAAQAYFSSLVTQIHKNFLMSTLCSYPVMGGIVNETNEKKKPKNDKTNQRNCNASEKFSELKPVGSRLKGEFSPTDFSNQFQLSCPNSYT